jgi:hypothetical protein
MPNQQYCTDAGQSRRQRVYARIEPQPGMLVFPLPSNAIRPAGDATMNQVPTYTDSSEKFDTLDLLDKFPNAMPPGDWSIPLYVRSSGFNRLPQGADLIQAAIGRVGTSVAAELADDATAADTSLLITVASGDVAQVGVVQIGTEMIRYRGYEHATGTLQNCVRAYNDTTSAAYVTGDEVVFLSTVYLLDSCAPTVSIWIETDHLIQFMSGCVVNEIKVPVQNEDGVKLSITGQGMRMGWAGKSAVKTAAVTGASSVTVNDPKRYSIEARIYNRTVDDHGSGILGYEIESINMTTGELRLKTALVTDWSVGDEVSGYLPPADVSGDVIESRASQLVLGGVPGKIKTTELTIGVPKEFLPNEIGAEFPEEYAGTVRGISMNLDCVFRRAALDKFYEGYSGEETSVLLTLGRVPGKKISFFMPRVKPSMPTVQFDGPALGLQIPASALGMVSGNQVGENSISVILE